MKDLNEKIGLYSILEATKKLIPADFFITNQRLFEEEEHFLKLAANLIKFYSQIASMQQSPPYFESECTPDLHHSYSFFEYSLTQWFNSGSQDKKVHIANFAEALYRANCTNILLLLGQRHTSGSLTDYKAIPPTQKMLITSATKIYKQDITAGTRAWTKHANRKLDNFWGIPTGTTAKKNQAAFEKINYVISNTTWWNVFEHYKHKTVYEARIASGHGIRWSNEGKNLIGFLEPFLDQ